MKNYIFVCVALSLILAITPRAIALNARVSRLIPTTLYTPMGFDDNDNSQIVIDGIYPDGCHSSGVFEFQVDAARKEILVSNGVVIRQAPCQMILIPYFKILDLGPLPAGEYKIYFLDANSNAIPKGLLPIRKSTVRASDEFLYAPVVDARVQSDEDSNSVELAGTFLNSCLKMKGATVIMTSENVVEILPIAQMSKEDCQQSKRDFNYVIKLKEPLRGRKLVHIRSMNGQSLNKIYNF